MMEGYNPVVVSGKYIAKQWWGTAWINNLSTLDDDSGVMERGIAYVRRGAVIDLNAENGKVNAKVQGSRSRPYDVRVDVRPLDTEIREKIVERCSVIAESSDSLSSGRISKEDAEFFTECNIFPSYNEMGFRCNCSDDAYICKHVAAVLCGIGARMDKDPMIVFALRGIDPDKLIHHSVEHRIHSMLENTDVKSSRILSDDAVSAVFGIVNVPSSAEGIFADVIEEECPEDMAAAILSKFPFGVRADARTRYFSEEPISSHDMGRGTSSIIVEDACITATRKNKKISYFCSCSDENECIHCAMAALFCNNIPRYQEVVQEEDVEDSIHRCISQLESMKSEPSYDADGTGFVDPVGEYAGSICDTIYEYIEDPSVSLELFSEVRRTAEERPDAESIIAVIDDHAPQIASLVSGISAREYWRILCGVSGAWLMQYVADMRMDAIFEFKDLLAKSGTPEMKQRYTECVKTWSGHRAAPKPKREARSRKAPEKSGFDFLDFPETFADTELRDTAAKNKTTPDNLLMAYWNENGSSHPSKMTRIMLEYNHMKELATALIAYNNNEEISYMKKNPIEEGAWLLAWGWTEDGIKILRAHMERILGEAIRAEYASASDALNILNRFYDSGRSIEGMPDHEELINWLLVKQKGKTKFWDIRGGRGRAQALSYRNVLVPGI